MGFYYCIILYLSELSRPVVHENNPIQEGLPVHFGNGKGAVSRAIGNLCRNRRGNKKQNCRYQNRRHFLSLKSESHCDF
jgi:hypothetical protein